MAKNYSEKWKQRKLSVYQKYNGRCSYCGNEIDFSNFQIDHIISKFEVKYFKEKYKNFNYEHIDNLNPSCCSCNNYKRAHSIEVFRNEIQSQVLRLRRDHPTFRLAERYGLIDCYETSIQFYFEKLNNGKKAY